MVAGQQTEHGDYDVARDVDRFGEVEPLRGKLALSLPQLDHLPKESVETENEIARVHDDATENAHLHHLLPNSNNVIGEVAHHMKQYCHLHPELQGAVDQEKELTTIASPSRFYRSLENDLWRFMIENVIPVRMLNM